MIGQDELQEIKDAIEDAARKVELEGTTLLRSPDVIEAEKQFTAWKAEKHEAQSLEEFRIPVELMRCILTTDQYNGLIFHGEGGIGKTILAVNGIKSMLKPEEWEYSNGYTTPLSLYEFLYVNRNRKAIIIDDVEGIFNNALSLSILKGALWDSDGKRIVQYSSKSDKAQMPQKFIMGAKVIILCNHIPKENDIGTRAMITRTIPYEVKFSFEEKMRICRSFIIKDSTLKPEVKEDILMLLAKHVTEATKDFNFRTLRKLMAFVQYDRKKAEELFRATTEIDTDREAYLKAVGTTNVVRVQIAMFIEWTGKSRRTFFNIKRQIGAKVQSNQGIAPAPAEKKEEEE